jgi:nicotinamide riboside kinase
MKIAICGTHCAGKSTLVDYLCETTNSQKIKEIAGNYTEKQRSKLPTQLKILLDQMNAEREHQSFVSDRSVIDNLAYIKFHAEKNESPQTYQKALKFVETYIETEKPYDILFFVDEYFELEDNGIRNLDKDQQEYVYNFLKTFAQQFCKEHNIKLVTICGKNEKRIEEIKKWIS